MNQTIKKMSSLVTEKCLHTGAAPERLSRLFNMKKICQYIDRRVMKIRIGESWQPYDEKRNLQKRVYASYSDYLRHQKSKLAHLSLERYDLEYRRVLRERLAAVEYSWRQKVVLCLGARLGTEVKAFADLGCFAVGIDLNPGKNNEYVVYGDFHNIQFAPGSVDVVFSNALDHAFSIDAISKEMQRVLKADGILIVEAAKGKEEGGYPQFYESMWWSKISDVVALLVSKGWRLVNRQVFSYPWPGEQIRFVKG